MEALHKVSKPDVGIYTLLSDYNQLFARIVKVYDSMIIRIYSKIRFTIININILHILALCLRGKRRILYVGCGFGLFGCYFSSLYPEISYVGYDLNLKRIKMANQAAQHLGLHNTKFYCRDARQLSLNDQFDVIIFIDLLHHLDDLSKHSLLSTCTQHLSSVGRLVIKDVTTRPFPKLIFTWVLDVLMTRGFQMRYWDEHKFHAVLKKNFNRIEMFPIFDWIPYPHVINLCENI